MDKEIVDKKRYRKGKVLRVERRRENRRGARKGTQRSKDIVDVRANALAYDPR